jgi:hypothetical protein
MWFSTYIHPTKWNFIIDEESLGYVLYVYEDYPDGFKKDILDKTTVHHMQDYYQNTFDITKESALEDFGVPLDSWVEVTPESIEFFKRQK